MPIEALRKQLLRHEGEVLHAYEDHLGYLTIGVGRLIDKRRGGGITHDEAMMLLDNDIRRVIDELESRAPWFKRLDTTRQQAIANMAFQLGVSGLLGFRKMIGALDHGDYRKAADEALDSRWARQTPNRAREIADMIRKG